MPLIAKAANLWRSLFDKSRLDRELDEELRGYLDATVKKKVDAGMDAAAARRAALAEMGGFEHLKHQVRDVRVGNTVESTLMDVRFAWRSLRQSPGFALVTVLTLALGIGANTAIFGVVNAMLIAPLPYRDASRLVFVWSDMTDAGFPRAPLSGPEVNDLQERSKLCAGFGAIWATQASLTGDGDPEQLRTGLVTTNFFSMLGADAALGRTFGPEDESTTEPETVLLSWALWQRRYGGDRTIVGRRILINNQPGTVVGVMPAEFRLLLPPDASVPDDLQAWQPLNQADLRGGRRGQKYLRVVGRMQPDVTLDQARTEISGIASLISREFNPKGARRLFNTVGLQADDVREVRPGLLALFGGVAILLLIACVNVASLLVARAAARTRETVLKRALGAGYGRLLRQCLVEGLLLATLGAVAGVVLARLGLTLLLTAKPESLSRISRVSIDSTVLAYTCGIALVWGLLFSLAPLTEVFRTDRAECGSLWLASCGICAIEALSKH